MPSSTKECDKVAEQLALDTGRSVKSFHSKIESQEKMGILKGYINNDIEIIVATTAFGMGVDKPNIKNVIHYEVSDSLESYAQEAGRGARDQDLEAYCPILFDEDDLDKHFATLNRSKLTASEINSIFRVIKSYKSKEVYKTAFELAKDAGWDVEDTSFDYATKVKTALLELQREGYISRKRNKVSFFADSIASDAITKLHQNLKNSKYTEEEKERFSRILQIVIGKGKTKAIQVDELAYLLGYPKYEIALCINQLKEMDILGNEKDLSLEASKVVMGKFKKLQDIELMIFDYLSSLREKTVSIREINEYLHNSKVINKNETELIKQFVKSWRDKVNFVFKRINREKDIWFFEFKDVDSVKNSLTKNHDISNKLIDYLKSKLTSNEKAKIEFSLKALKDYLDKKYTLKEIDRTLLYLHNLKIVELLNGRFISYSPMSIYKNDKLASKRKYTEYKARLEPYYKTKVESIHIMGEYASRLKHSHSDAMKFLKDYFTLDYKKFIKRYELVKEKIARPITQKRFDKIYKEMSDEQKQIIEDKTTKAMMILAGPGSGKTKVLVHKIASIILTEDVKPEQFMMLTFSKSAKWEFKSRLNALIGSLSYDVEIQTFHSYALKLIARESKDDKSILNNSIGEASKQIVNGDIKLPHIAVLVLDEYQDINEDSFAFIKAIYEANSSDIRIIAVGDDDQCIMDFAGANVEFIKRFEDAFSKDEDEKSFKKYELLCNFRSDKNIVQYANEFRQYIPNKYKESELYSASKKRGSCKYL
ncbi:MAG: AAA family ATPase [Sulfurovum sp.]|nr:AAA family ATPase [Sulfurovum sp.]